MRKEHLKSKKKNKQLKDKQKIIKNLTLVFVIILILMSAIDKKILIQLSRIIKIFNFYDLTEKYLNYID